MTLKGKWWLLVDDEPFSTRHGRTFELCDGQVSDGRTGVPLGNYTVTDQGADLLFDESDGEREVVKLRMFSTMALVDGEPVEDAPAFDPDADSLRAYFSTHRFEAYAATRRIDPNETDDQRYEREQREEKEFGWFHPFAMVHRDSEEIRQMAEANDFESDEWERRSSAGA
jgi:hypothetical protein